MRHQTSKSAAPPRRVEIADALNGMLQRIWKEQDRTKSALTIGPRLRRGLLNTSCAHR